MIRDRGIIKWGAFKIPEHENLLLDTWKEMQKESKPDLTEWELEDLQLKIDVAAEQGYLITLTVWEDSKFIELIGTIKGINRDAGCLTIHSLNGSKKIPFSALFKACLEE
ncbi:YolD-like family protein [Lysinibacillus fusiformis]|uniref:YolD-like family protein n=1 Tax=Lysinibacillus fusiformis TaxID=28031 RepID=UPI0018812677|nr:YolD-like family protein [Lysinibacillus fusiformis]MBD8523825.1 YolD-like family protein [Lysinibacillus fusiformis]